MLLIELSGLPPLGHEPMDEVHEEFERLLQTAQAVPDDELMPLLQQIEQHCQAHFSQEERWMAGGDFPGASCHIQEHSAVLASIAGVLRRVGAGEWYVGRTLVQSLHQWFPAHAQHLDSALAHWLNKKRWGAKPLVFHRSGGRITSARVPSH